MPPKKVSTSIGPEQYERLKEVADATNRTAQEVISAALQFYTALPLAAQEALDELATLTDARIQERISQELHNVLLRARWEIIAAKTARVLRERPPGSMTDEELLRLAEEAIAESRRLRK